MAVRPVFTLVILNFLNFITQSSSLGRFSGNIDELIVTREARDSRTRNPREEWPVCVFYRDPRTMSHLEESLLKFLRSLTDDSFLKDWTVMAFNIDKGGLLLSDHPGTVPLLQCHTWTANSPLHYTPNKPSPSIRSFHKWFKHVGKIFSKRIRPVDSDKLSEVIVSHVGYTVVGLPGHLHHHTLEQTLQQVARSWKEKIKVLAAIPFTEDEKFMTIEFNISKLPAVIGFTSQMWTEERKPMFVLQGIEEVVERRIKILLLTLESQAIQLTLDNFLEEVMEAGYPQPPVVVCFYSPRSPRTLNYLDAFHRSLETFTRMQILLRFGLLNIIGHPKVIPRYVNATQVYAVPFTVVFWQKKTSGTQRFEIKQQVFDKDIPTPLVLFEFLQALSLDLQFASEDEEELYNPWKESDDSKNVCSLVTEKNKCTVGDNMTLGDSKDEQYERVMYGPALPPASWTTTTKAHPVKKKVFQIPYVNDKVWASVIEQSVAPTTSYTASPVHQSSSLFSVAVVVFVADGCSYCAKVMPIIEEISRDVKFVGATLYMHNCSSDPLTCQRYSITGFPTVTAFRSLSWSTVETCSRSRATFLRLDYHGPIVPRLVLEWLSNVSQSAVNRRFLFDSPPDMDVDVRLIGTVYTRSLARRYLSTSLVNKWYPFHCFQLICELLFGRVPCLVIYTRDVSDDGSKANAKDQDLVLSKLELQRSDGVRVKVFQLGQNVESTINNQRDSRLHMFHETHRYNLPRNFRCEHDHSLCTDVAVRFVQDHRRLPVIHLTSAAFHTKLGSEEDANFEPFGHNLPILIALVHKVNVSRKSSFYKELTEAAYALYREMVVVTLDVEEFAYWASNFVPKGYHAKHAFGKRSESVPPLYRYPRLCIIQHDDHHHAAFYPPTEELQRMVTSVQAKLDQINAQRMIKFALDYMRDPKGSVTRTEMF